MIPDPGRKNEQIRMNHAINSTTASLTKAAQFLRKTEAVVNCFVCIYFAFGGGAIYRAAGIAKGEPGSREGEEQGCRRCVARTGNQN